MIKIVAGGGENFPNEMVFDGSMQECLVDLCNALNNLYFALKDSGKGDAAEMMKCGLYALFQPGSVMFNEDERPNFEGTLISL